MKLSNGADVTPVEKEELAALQKLFHAYTGGLVRAGPARCILPEVSYNMYAERYLNMQVNMYCVLHYS